MASKEYKRQGYAPDLSESDNVSAVTRILLETIKAGRPAAYPDTPQGLEDFKEATVKYLEHVQKVNESGIEKKVMVDIESWACYLGTTRATIATYERTRDEKWQEFIAVTKNGIAAAKKEAAFHGQLQPMIAVFDLANNHNYKNTNEFKLETAPKEPERKIMLSSELPVLLVTPEEREKWEKEREQNGITGLPDLSKPLGTEESEAYNND